jgi:hypothetical protein
MADSQLIRTFAQLPLPADIHAEVSVSGSMVNYGTVEILEADKRQTHGRNANTSCSQLMPPKELQDYSRPVARLFKMNERLNNYFKLFALIFVLNLFSWASQKRCILRDVPSLTIYSFI